MPNNAQAIAILKNRPPYPAHSTVFYDGHGGVDPWVARYRAEGFKVAKYHRSVKAGGYLIPLTVCIALPTE